MRTCSTHIGRISGVVLGAVGLEWTPVVELCGKRCFLEVSRGAMLRFQNLYLSPPRARLGAHPHLDTMDDMFKVWGKCRRQLRARSAAAFLPCVTVVQE